MKIEKFIPKHVEVLVAATIPKSWEVVQKNPHIATQKKNSADAEYIAFFRVRLGDRNMRSAITHIAKVKGSNNKVLMEKGKAWEHKKYHKEYSLGKIEKLRKPIRCRKGEGKRCQVKLYTTLAEFYNAEYLGDIKTVSQLEQNKKSGV